MPKEVIRAYISNYCYKCIERISFVSVLTFSINIFSYNIGCLNDLRHWLYSGINVIIYLKSLLTLIT